jgi:hypothetical protein
MAFAARQPHTGDAAQQPNTSIVGVHTCARCNATLDSTEPRSMVRPELRVCGVCRGQEQVLLHLPVSRAGWSARLARRAA